MKTTIFLSLILLLAANQLLAQEKENVILTIEVEGTIPQKGSLILSLYTSEETWLKQPLTVLTHDLTSDNSHSFVIEDLPSGTYAFSVYHDTNNNKTLDMGNMGPTEAYGFSNGARGQYGPAPFSEAKIMVNEDTTTKIMIR